MIRDSRFMRELTARRAVYRASQYRITGEVIVDNLYATMPHFVVITQNYTGKAEMRVGYASDDPDERKCTVDPRIRYGTLQ